MRRPLISIVTLALASSHAAHAHDPTAPRPTQGLPRLAAGPACHPPETVTGTVATPYQSRASHAAATPADGPQSAVKDRAAQQDTELEWDSGVPVGPIPD